MKIHLRCTIIALAIALLASCAWGYAGEDGKVTREPEPETKSQVVSLKESEKNAEQPTEGGETTQEATLERHATKWGRR